MINDNVVNLISPFNINGAYINYKNISQASTSINLKNSVNKTANSLEFVVIPLRYFQSSQIAIPSRSLLLNSTLLLQSDIPDAISLRFPKMFYPLSKRLVKNATVVLYSLVHYKYGILSIWYDTKNNLIMHIDFSDAGYFITGTSCLDFSGNNSNVGMI
jgi:hypothetical protein